MKLIWKLLSAGLALSALALPVYADAPGKTLQPIYAPPAPKPAPAPALVQSRTYTTQPTTTYVYRSTTPSQSDIRNQAEARRIVTTQQQHTVIYRHVAPQPQPVQPTYRYVTTQVPVCPTYSYQTRTTYTVRHAPAPTHCAVPAPQPRPVHPAPQPHHPCPAHGQTGYSKHTCPVHAPKQITYVPIPVETCEGKIIERMSDTRDGRKQYSVCYSDLTHLPPQDFSWALLERMERASDKACEQSSSVLYSIRAERECREETLERSVYETKMPLVINAYLVKTGKRQPKVHVGDPIYH